MSKHVLGWVIRVAACALATGCFDPRIVPVDGGASDGRAEAAMGTGGMVGASGGGGGTAGSGGTGGGGGTGNLGGATSSGGAGTAGAGGNHQGIGGAASGGVTSSGGMGTAGSGGNNQGTGGAATGGVTGIGGAGTAGAGGRGLGDGGAGIGGRGTGGTNTGGGAGAGGSGMGGGAGAPVVLFNEDFEDGNTEGWTLGFTDHYTSSILAGTGANGTSRSLALTKSMDSIYCCEGFNRVFTPGLQPRAVSYWIRSDQTGPVVGTFRLSSMPDASDSIVYTDFSGTNILLHTSGGTASVAYVAGQWYHLELRDIDWQTHTYRFVVDGVQIGGIRTMPTAAASLARIDLFSNRSTTATPPVVYFDQIELR